MLPPARGEEDGDLPASEEASTTSLLPTVPSGRTGCACFLSDVRVRPASAQSKIRRRTRTLDFTAGRSEWSRKHQRKRNRRNPNQKSRWTQEFQEAGKGDNSCLISFISSLSLVVSASRAHTALRQAAILEGLLFLL